MSRLVRISMFVVIAGGLIVSEVQDRNGMPGQLLRLALAFLLGYYGTRPKVVVQEERTSPVLDATQEALTASNHNLQRVVDLLEEMHNDDSRGGAAAEAGSDGPSEDRPPDEK